MNKTNDNSSIAFVHVEGLPKKAPKPGRHLRLVTFNVHYGKNPSAIARAIKENQNLKKADIILMQEIESYKSEPAPRAQAVAEKLNMHFAYAPARPAGITGTHGLATLSRYPILDAEIIPLEPFKMLFRSRSRIALNVTVDIGGTEWKIVNLHLDTLINAHERIRQLRPVIDSARTSSKKPTVIAGDFNTLPAYFYKRLIPIFIDDQKKVVDSLFSKHGFKSHVEEIRYTMRRGYISFLLDSIYIRGKKAVKYGMEENVRVSDHQPLWVDIALK